MLNPALFAVLCCPKCRGPLAEQNAAEQAALVCAACRLRYAIADGIPNLLIDEAQPLDAQA